MVYLLKVTIAWGLLLVLFEVFYKHNGRFTANRLYLLLSMGLGLVLPLIPLPSSAPRVMTHVAQNFQPAPATPTAAVLPPAAPAIAATGTHGLDLSLILLLIYGAGVLFLFVRCVIDLSKIARLMKHPAERLYGHQVIETGKVHAPYSFMGRIFITDRARYTPQELAYILEHEAAHSTRKHWLDLWLMQLACMIGWFHPLVWRYRYQLQLQHEYEADRLAADNDPYTYGHFLLQQTLLNGVPAMAHSFHFSPIKNRIYMLTQKHSLTSASWKYLLLIPALLGCTFLMARATTKTTPGYATSFKDRTFLWRETDTFFYDREKKQAARTPAALPKKQIIYEMNGEPVYQNEYQAVPATCGPSAMSYIEYLNIAFRKQCQHTSDSLTNIIVRNLVINKEGKVVFYDVRYFRPYSKIKYIDPFPGQESTLNKVMDKIIAEGPDWKPAAVNGQPVNSLISFNEGC